MQRYLNQHEIDNAFRSVYSALHSAQINSQTSGYTTVICASTDNDTCDSSMGFSPGWMIYNDADENYNLDASERVIASKQLRNPELRLQLNSTAQGVKIIFYRNGRLWPNGNLTVCHVKLDSGYQITLTQSGRIRHHAIARSDCI